MKNITYSKTSQIDGNKKLYAITDEFGHTVIQVWSELKPIELIKTLTKEF